MNRSMETRIASLRGPRDAEEPGARKIERVARNPECLRLRAVTIAGITPATAAREILGMPDREGQSPFALTLGQRFERRLTEYGAANLLTLYRDKGRLTVADAKVVNVEDLAPGSDLRARRRRETETRRILEAKFRADPDAPNVVIKPRLAVYLLDVPHPIEPDYLIASDADRFYRVGEIKSYADRDGKTEPADIRSACRQAAVGVIALRQALAVMGAAEPSLLIDAACDLILRAPGSFTPTLRAMTIAGEVASLDRAQAEAPRNLAVCRT